MKLKIISDGTKAGTRVVNADTGEEVDDVVRIEWRMDGRDGVASAVMHFEPLPADLVIDEGQISLPVAPAAADIHLHSGGNVIYHEGFLANYGYLPPREAEVVSFPAVGPGHGLAG